MKLMRSWRAGGEYCSESPQQCFICKQLKEAELKIFTLLVHLKRNNCPAQNLQRNCFEPLRDNQSCEENPSLFFKGSKNHFFESTRF